MKFNEILGQVKSILTNFAGANLSFGKPMTVNEMTIIPVAKTAFGFGGGGGNSSRENKAISPDAPKPEEPETPVVDSTEIPPEEASEAKPETATPEANYGGGGGGGLKTEPIGIYVIRGESVKFYPVLKFEQILATLAVVSAIIIRFIKLKRK